MTTDNTSLIIELEKYINAKGYATINELNDYTRSLKHMSKGQLVSYKISNGERRLRQLVDDKRIKRVPEDEHQYVKGYTALGGAKPSESDNVPKAVQTSVIARPVALFDTPKTNYKSHYNE